MKITPPRLPVGSLAAQFYYASLLVVDVLEGFSLADNRLELVPSEAKPAVQNAVYTTLRAYGQGQFYLRQLLRQPLTVPEIEALLLVSLARLASEPESAYVTVDQAVECAGCFAQGKLRGMVNAVLRNALRQNAKLQAAMQDDPEGQYQHPTWWLRRVQRAYPQDWAAIMAAGNSKPPMALRVNPQRTSVTAYLALLAEAGIAARAGDMELVAESTAAGVSTVATATTTSPTSPTILLDEAVPVSRLPHFAAGWVSVQDPGAQQAALRLAPQASELILDACAAPGGKTAHLLELAPVQLVAVELEAQRAQRINENLARLQLNAAVKIGDAARPQTWWDGKPFDAILADVPCSASGVIRRHPDAKWLRRDEDIARFARTQAAILTALWPCLKPGGRLLYATCSVFPEENTQQITKFLAKTPDAGLRYAHQLLPSATHDGFYYALLDKAV